MPCEFDTGRSACSRSRLKAMCSAREPLFEELEPRQMLAADLALTSLVLGPAGPVTVGTVVSMTPTYRNVGNALSQASDLRIVLSRNAIYGDADDIEIFPAATGLSDNVAPLAAGAQLVGGAILAPIPVLTPGQYRVIGHVAGATPDANIANDTFVLATVLTVNGPASGPDLVVAQAFTGTYRPGDSVDGMFNVTNNGVSAITTLPPRLVAMYLSTDGVLGNADDIPVTDLFPQLNFHFSGIAPGETNDAGAHFLIPAMTPPGTYRVITVLDPELYYAESDEGNNIFIPASSTIVVALPDLAVTFTGNATVRAGEAFTGTLTARNTGTAFSDAAPFRVRLVSGATSYTLLTGDLAGPDGPATNTHTLTAGQVVTLTGFQVPVPINIPVGTYRVYVDTDPDNTVQETITGEANNVTGPLGTIVVQGVLNPPLLADLVPASAAVLPGINSAYRAFAMSLSLFNYGSHTADNSTVESWFSVNTIFGDADDRLISATELEIPQSLPGGLFFGRFGLVLPDDIASGVYSIFLHVTPGILDEALNNQDNNTIRVPITVQNPDIVGTIAAPTTATAGAFITPTITFRNAGTARLSTSSRHNVFLRPAGATDAAQDVLLTTVRTSGLAVGESITFANSPMSIPASIATGPYRLVLVADATDTVREGGAAENNTFLSAGLVTVTNPGNLTGYDVAVRVPALSATLRPGESLEFTPWASNIGDPNPPTTTFSYYLSTNPTFDASDILVDDRNYSFDDRITSQNSTTSFQVPAWTPGGSYYFLGVADSDGTITEYNEANNVHATATASIIVVRPTVSIAVMDGTATEVAPGSTPDGGAYRITRTGPLDESLVVNYTVSGTASMGNDFVPLPMRVVIPAGQSSVLVPLTVNDDISGEAAETVVVRLGLGAGYSINLASNSATVTIADNEPRVTAAVVDGIGTEVAGGVADGVRFSITRTGPTTSPLRVYLLWEGSASANDYDGEASSFLIAAGQSTLVIPLSVVEDIYGEPAETLTMRIASADGYAPGTVATATATINDNEPIVTIAAVDATAAQTRAGEAVNTGQFRFTRTGPTTQPLTVYYTIGGTAPNGDVYVNADTGLALTGQLTILAGQASALLTIGPRVFPIAAPATVVLTVNNAPNTYLYRGASPNTPATVTIANLPPVNLYTGEFVFAAGESVVYLYSAGQDLRITYGFSSEGIIGTIPGFISQIRLSVNPTIGDADDIVLASVNTPAGPGNFPLMLAVIDWDQMPAILPGVYYVGLFIDSGGAVGEFNEADNRHVYTATQLQFIAAEGP